jgi:predicted TIM-barrel fold metal-dependent hydrolase
MIGHQRRFFATCGCCGTDGAGVNRRTFLDSAAATALVAPAIGRLGEAAAQTAPAPASRRIIDVHHHIAPPAYLGETRAAQQPPTIGWSLQKSLDDMDKAGVASAISSITTPGIWFGDDAQAQRLARACNDYAAKLAQDHPGRFGMFAALPLPNVDAALRESEYALDTLKADGIGLLTSFGDKWLGDPAFDPLMAELNRRKAVVYTHPTTADCCRNLVPQVPLAMIEYGTDTTRAIASLLFRGGAKKFPDIKFIFSHAGGTMPFLIERFLRLGPQQNVPGGVAQALKTFYYDIAQSSHPIPLAALVKLVSTSQIVFGTDFPFRTSAEHAKALVDFGFSADDLRAVDRDNVVKLLPKYRS